MDHNLGPTTLEYFDDMFKFQSTATLLSSFQTEDGRQVLILDSTIFHPQGGGQPADTGLISISDFKFIVQDVGSRDKIVYHYGRFENSDDGNLQENLEIGVQVLLSVDEQRRRLNSRLHSAGHVLDICINKVGWVHLVPTEGCHFPNGLNFSGLNNVGWGHLEPAEGFHFPNGPFVEYEGVLSLEELHTNHRRLEVEANILISNGGMVFALILPYDEASDLCGGHLPDYIPRESTPRIVKLGENPGCPCGGTHVNDISEILSLKVSGIRTVEGQRTRVFYNVG